MKFSDLRTQQQVVSDHLARDPTFRAEWDRTALARAVALRVVRYRRENNLSQSALGRRLGMPQPQIARIESGAVNPSIETLMRLSAALGAEFHISVRPAGDPPSSETAAAARAECEVRTD